MRFHHLALMVLIQFVWGVNFVALKYAVMDFSPILANGLRFLMVAVLLLPFLKIVKGQMKTVLKIAFILGILHFGTVMFAIAYAGGVSEVAIVAQLSVPFSTILAVIMLREVIHWKRIVGIAISFGGVVLLGFDPRVFNHMDAAFLVMISALSIALASIYMRRINQVSPLTIQAWVGIAGVTGSLALSFIFESGQIEQIVSASNIAWGAVLFSAAGSTVLGHGGINYLFRFYEVSVVSPYMLLMPLFGVAASVVMLDETLTARMIWGGIITLIGVIIITLRNQKRKLPQPGTDGASEPV